MATVPVETAPSVAPSAAPAPLQQISAPAAAFGANVVGEGASELGKAATAASNTTYEYATKVQAIANKQAADSQGIAAATAVDKLVSDWRTNNTQGQAVATYPALLSKIEETRQQFGQNLSPIAKSDFEELSRRFTFSSISQASNYAAEQGHQGMIATADANAKVAGQLYATNPTPDNEATFHKVAGASAAQFFATAGLNPNDPQVRQKLLQYTSPAYSTVISNAYASGDLDGANKLLDAHKTDLTDEAYATLSRGLRVANQANQIQSDAQQALHGGVWTQPTGLSAPDSRAARNNNPGNLTPLANGQWEGQTGTDGHFATFATPQAGAAAADKNLAAYGSLHGINTLAGVINRWAPPGENDTAAYVAQVAKATGIDPNAHIDLSDPATRAKILPAMFAVEGGGSGAHVSAQVHLQGVPAPAPNQDPNAYLAQAESVAAANAKVMYPNNAEQQQKVIAAAYTQAHREIAPVDAAQKADYDTMAEWASKNQIQDPSLIAQQFPTQWANARATYRESLEREATFNSNYMDDAKKAQVLKLDGELGFAGTDPSVFLGEDIRSMNLPLSVKQHFIQAQQQVGQDRSNTASFTDKLLSSTTQGKAALHSLGLDQPGSQQTDQYYQFAGALKQSVDSFREAHAGAEPQGADLNKLISQTVALAGQHGGNFIPAVDAAQITDAYRLAGLGVPTQAQIAAEYARHHGAK